MKKNLGTLDRTVRWIIAAIIGVGYLTGLLTGIIGNILLGLAVFITFTASMSWCPVYPLLGLNTCADESDLNELEKD